MAEMRRPVLPNEIKDTVSIREFEQRISNLMLQIENRIQAEAELIETKSNLLDKALALQAKEYERRLFELNHAHEIALENWRMSLPREMFDLAQTEFVRWKDLVNLDLTNIKQDITHAKETDVKLVSTVETVNQINGALTLIRFMGFAGVTALIVTMLKMAGALP